MHNSSQTTLFLPVLKQWKKAAFYCKKAKRNDYYFTCHADAVAHLTISDLCGILTIEK